MKFDEILANASLPFKKREFVESVKMFYETRGHITPAQEKYWNSIYEDYCETGRAKREAWVAGYDAEKKKIALICAKYYFHNSQGYFQALASQVIENPDFIPSEKQYKAMCTNKYAVRIIEETAGTPKYEVGSFVQFRAGKIPYNLRAQVLGPTSTNCAMVLETNAFPPRVAAKGSKMYRVLIVGDATPILAEERQLKKYRGKNGKN